MCQNSHLVNQCTAVYPPASRDEAPIVPLCLLAKCGAAPSTRWDVVMVENAGKGPVAQRKVAMPMRECFGGLRKRKPSSHVYHKRHADHWLEGVPRCINDC